MRARNIIDSVLMEMPRYRLRSSDNLGHPKITYNIKVDTYDRKFICKAEAHLTGGDVRSFVIGRPMTPSEYQQAEALSAGGASGPVYHRGIETTFASQLTTVKDAAIAKATAWIKANDSPPVDMDDVEKLVVSTDAIPIVKDFRYTFVGSSGGVMGTGPAYVKALASFSHYVQPGDKLVYVAQKTLPEKSYYVIVNPEEYLELKRRVILANRQELGRAMSEEPDDQD